MVIVKYLNIARGMSTAGIDHANILYSKFCNEFYSLEGCLEIALMYLVLSYRESVHDYSLMVST